MGVLLRRAGLILALGVVVGMLVGGGLMASVITLLAAGRRRPLPRPLPRLPRRPRRAASPAAVAPSPPCFGYTDVGIPGAPAGASTALTGTAAVNGRIASTRKRLPPRWRAVT